MAILQAEIPYATDPQRLPGIKPMEADAWIVRDDVFAGQMALRDSLLLHDRARVFSDAGANPAAKSEVLQQVLDVIARRPGYSVGLTSVLRPDGVRVDLSDDPLVCAARLVQEDLLIHEKQGDEHVLTAGVLCFPASWTLAEKVGHPLSRVHKPVDEYTPDVAKRVQRLFDGIKAGKPLWRFNVLTYPTADLFQPRYESAPRRADDNYETGQYSRSEHQALLRLPASDAVLFAIHTYVVALPDP